MLNGRVGRSREEQERKREKTVRCLAHKNINCLKAFCSLTCQNIQHPTDHFHYISGFTFISVRPSHLIWTSETTLHVRDRPVIAHMGGKSYPKWWPGILTIWQARLLNEVQLLELQKLISLLHLWQN